MPAILAENCYGKSAVRLVAVRRGEVDTRHEIKDLTVDVALAGDFESAHRDGDNSTIYPTDSMKNSVYILARRHGVEEIEEFAELLARHYLGRATAPSRVAIEISERPWQRVAMAGDEHPHAFVGTDGERRLTRVTADRDGGVEFASGLRELRVLKTTGSAFSGFPRDETTTLRETRDRIFATTVEAMWTYRERPPEFGAAHRDGRRALLEAFAGHASESVQQTLFAMGESLLAAVPASAAVNLRLPNQHHLLVDLAPFGLDNANAVFVPTSEPFGDIRATVRRA